MSYAHRDMFEVDKIMLRDMAICGSFVAFAVAVLWSFSPEPKTVEDPIIGSCAPIKEATVWPDVMDRFWSWEDDSAKVVKAITIKDEPPKPVIKEEEHVKHYRRRRR